MSFKVQILKQGLAAKKITTHKGAQMQRAQYFFYLSGTQLFAVVELLALSL